YQVAHWQRLRREQPRLQTLPPIVPVLVHCGARRWRASCDLRALLDLDDLPPELAASQPQLAFPVHDFADRSPEEVRRMALSLFGLATIAAQVFVAPVANDERALAARLVDWLDVLRRIGGDPGGQDAIRALSSYLLSITKLSRRRLQVVIQRQFGS